MHPVKKITRDATHQIFLIAVFLAIYNIIRVLKVSVTYDEALTYMLYVNNRYKNIIACDPVVANDHIFNSLLAKICVNLFDQNAFFLRLPNIIAHLIYLLYGYLLLHYLFRGKRWWIFCGFLLLNLNPFLFDFWGLCRGYGLSIAFMMASLYHLLRYTYATK